MRRAVFLDRDGVINAMVLDPEHGTLDSPLHEEQFKLLQGAAEAVGRINRSGYLAIVVSNQPGIAKGKMTEANLEAVTVRMEEELAAQGARLDGIYYCLHHPEATVQRYLASCNCRKPEPGLLFKAAGENSIDLTSSFMVGDGIMDIEAGAGAGCKTVWLGNWKCDHCKIMQASGSMPDMVAANLLEAVMAIEELGAG